MIARGDLCWGSLPAPVGRRPVCVLTRDAVLAVIDNVTVAVVTETIRGLRSEVEVGPAQGLPHRSVVSCDNLATVPRALLDSEPVGRLDVGKRAELDQALRFALDIRY